MGIHTNAGAYAALHSRRGPTQTYTLPNKHEQIAWGNVMLLNGVSLPAAFCFPQHNLFVMLCDFVVLLK